jgi:hypothetical protein
VAVNELIAELNPWFPRQALSADCAERAWKASVALAKQWWRAQNTDCPG